MIVLILWKFVILILIIISWHIKYPNQTFATINGS
jgi:hypothetical protein